MACLPHCRIAPVSSMPVGENKKPPRSRHRRPHPARRERSPRQSLFAIAIAMAADMRGAVRVRRLLEAIRDALFKPLGFKPLGLVYGVASTLLKSTLLTRFYSFLSGLPNRGLVDQFLLTGSAARKPPRTGRPIPSS